ncbi:MAG: hypothetical protein N2049_04025, partial [Anaerolineales bacterium]|nr:hypothetical protein [Anaerolineales bacterium]
MFPRIVMFLLLIAFLGGCAVPSSITPPPMSPTIPALLPSATSIPATSPLPATTPQIFPEPTTDSPRPFVVRTAKADLWDDPQHEGEYWHLQTQLLLGEKVFVLQTKGDWAYIVAVEQPSHKHELGYPGWIRLEALATGWPSAREYAVVMTPFSLIRSTPNGERVMQVYL